MMFLLAHFLIVPRGPVELLDFRCWGRWSQCCWGGVELLSKKARALGARKYGIGLNDGRTVGLRPLGICDLLANFVLPAARAGHCAALPSRRHPGCGRRIP